MSLFIRKQWNTYVLLLLLTSASVSAQVIDHWEGVVKNTSLWSYTEGSPDINPDWIYTDVEVDWEQGIGGFGNSDDDDRVILNDVKSLYIKTDFDIVNKEAISTMVLHADFDDGFVAYLNGVEIARCNLGIKGIRTPYNVLAYESVEAAIFAGVEPMTFYFCEEELEELLHQGSNTLAIQIHNAEARDGDFSSNFYLSVGVTDDSVNYRSVPWWFKTMVFETELPIIKITTLNGTEIVDEPKVEAHMGISYKEGESTLSCINEFNDYNGRIGIELRGTSSLEYHKKNYGFETRYADGSNNNASLLGMPKENDWVLHGPYSDKTLLRNALTFHMGSLTGEYTPRYELCELFINSKYRGVYVLMEKIKRDKNRVDISKLTENENSGDDVTGGYIFKVDRNLFDIPDIGWDSSFPNYNFLAYVYPKADDITDAQQNYIQDYYYKFEQAMFEDNYESTYLDYIDMKSWADYILVTEIAKHIDAYKLSFYMYKDKDSKGGKLHLGPLWDFNLGYGNFDFGCSIEPEGWSYDFVDCGSRFPFWVNKIVEIPEVKEYTSCRWQELRAGPFRTDSLMSYIDNQVSRMGGAPERNFEKWPVLGVYIWPNGYVVDTYEEEIAFLKTWLTARLEWMDDNLEAECEGFLSINNDIVAQELKVYPNPVSEILNIDIPDSQGGTIYVYNSQGQEICSQTIDVGEALIRFPVHEYSEGAYTIRVISKDSSIAYTNRFNKVGQ